MLPVFSFSSSSDDEFLSSGEHTATSAFNVLLMKVNSSEWPVLEMLVLFPTSKAVPVLLGTDAGKALAM